MRLYYNRRLLFWEEARMRAKLVAAALFAVFLGNASEAVAQCTALVRDGVFETFNVGSDSVSASAFMNWVRDHRSSTSSSDVGGGISIPVIGSLNGSSQQYAQLESDYAAMNSGSSTARSRLITHARSVSAVLAQRFNECMAIKGLHVWLETTDDPRVFKVAAVFNSPGPAQVRATIETVARVPSSVSCDGSIGANTAITGSTRRMLCTRGTRDAVTMILNADSDPIGGGELKLAAIPVPPPPPTCNSEAMVSRGAAASHERLTDGVVGSNSPGQNSGRPGGNFWVELGQPEWVRRIVVHPFMNGTVGSNQVIGYYSSGGTDELATFRTNGPSSSPISVTVDLNKSKNIKKVEVITSPDDGRGWVAWTEIQVYACR
jgi:hypothetical protein